MAIDGGDKPTSIVLKQCTVINSTAGSAIEDDPQGEGGAVVVGAGATLVLEDCLVVNNTCGRKVGLWFGYERMFDLLGIFSV